MALQALVRPLRFWTHLLSYIYTGLKGTVVPVYATKSYQETDIFFHSFSPPAISGVSDQLNSTAALPRLEPPGTLGHEAAWATELI